MFGDGRRHTLRIFRSNGLHKEEVVEKELDDKLDPKAKGAETPKADFDRNRDGLYGGLPKTRDKNAPGPEPKSPHPPR